MSQNVTFQHFQAIFIFYKKVYTLMSFTILICAQLCDWTIFRKIFWMFEFLKFTVVLYTQEILVLLINEDINKRHYQTKNWITDKMRVAFSFTLNLVSLDSYLKGLLNSCLEIYDYVKKISVTL